VSTLAGTLLPTPVVRACRSVLPCGGCHKGACPLPLGVVFAPREHYVGTTASHHDDHHAHAAHYRRSVGSNCCSVSPWWWWLPAACCPLLTCSLTRKWQTRHTCDLPNQLQVRFAAPVLPGSKLTVEMWAEGDRILFVTLVDGKVVINNAYVDLTPSARM
jgi:hypothetical protein